MRKLFREKKPGGGFYPEWRFRYQDEFGTLKQKKGYADKAKTLRLQLETLQQVEARRREMESGEVAGPSQRPLPELKADYMAWGALHGGKQGQPWAEKHVKNVERDLSWWLETLPARTLSQIRLSDVEKALSERKAAGTGSAGLESAAGVLRAFLNWAIRRKMIRENPLTHLGHFDRGTQVPYREMTVAEIERLFPTLRHSRAVLYRTALISGARRTECARFRVRNFSAAAKTLSLVFKDSGDTKNKKGAIFGLPDSLAADIAMLCAGKDPEDPIFDDMASNPARALQREAKAAGIPILTERGRLVFHSLRVTFCNMLVEEGADYKTAQTLMRHSDPRLTANIYSRAQESRLHAAVSRVDDRLAAVWMRRKSDGNLGGVSAEPAGLDENGRGDTIRINVPAFSSLATYPDTLATFDSALKSKYTPKPKHFPDTSATLDATEKRRKALEHLYAIVGALSPENLDLLLEFGDRLVANQKQAAGIRRNDRGAA